MRNEAMTILQREERLQQIVKLVGPDVLPDSQRLILFVAEMIKDSFLTQSAFDENDMYCSPEKQVVLLRLILNFYKKARDLIQLGVPLLRIRSLKCVPQIIRAKITYGNKELDNIAQLEKLAMEEMDALEKEFYLTNEGSVICKTI